MVSTPGESPTGEPRIRQRGVPMAHAPEKFTGEMILFIMDLAVNKATGMLLYRLHDDLFLCGEPSRCAQAWKEMEEFADVMGVEFNKSKTGSVYLTNPEKSRDADIQATLPEGVHIQKVLFKPADLPQDDENQTTAEGNVVDYLKSKIKERFGVSDVSDAFIFLPEK
ncbi:hypothetical protein F5B21DRAFT_501685 [Xylaria acuta]|nr:hypothetical protein F5B21DRAFT_501685 [Xylaria acuta]